MNAEGIYRGKCEYGHDIDCRVQGYNFELLINSAVNSFVQNDFRSAILDMASAQERFFEFIIDVLVQDLNLNKDSPNISDYLNKIKKRSETELHVFLTLFAARFKDVPFKFGEFENKTKIRNSVVHKGKIADRKSAKEYCDYVVNNIQDILQVVLEKIDRDVIDRVWYVKNKSTTPTRSVMYSSMISWTTLSQEEIANEKKLSTISEDTPTFYAEMAAKATEENKILWVNDAGKLTLMDPQKQPGLDQPKKYCYRRTFEEMIESLSHMQNHFENTKVINMF